MRLQPRQRGWAGSVTPDTLAFLATQPSITVLDGGEVLMCGGWLPLWEGRAMAWSMLAEGIGTRMTGVVRAARRMTDTFTGRRLELDVERDHAEAHRLARLLGFTLETPCMPRFYPNGADAAMYVRIAAWA
ncbi:hypothetical protein [Rhodanobacter denitrificans]|nr:hypothetical protein [Rhodanobacter denitrificans]